MSAESPVRIEPDATVSSPKLPTVSIILPVLNEEAQLERCLSSVAEQSYPAIIEVVVADGGSTDGTPIGGVQVRESARRRQPEAHPSCRPEHCHCGRFRRHHRPSRCSYRACA